jgi:hypothetical protein
MNKVKLVLLAGATMAIAAVSVFAAQAATPLTVSCGSSVSGNVVTWTASTTGGNAPVALLWSGATGIAGSTSTSMNVTYGMNATYSAMIQAMDASSTVATSTCTATVTANTTPTPTSTVNVVLGVNNTAGGSAVPANFTVSVNGAAATPSSFAGSGTSTAVTVNAGQSFSVVPSMISNYSATFSGTCSGSLSSSTIASCAVTETYVPSTVTPTSTPPLPRVNPPSLSIGANGSFLARGMTVTSVASGSFQATVWGITYTVDWTGGAAPEFIFRKGNDAPTVTDPTTQLQVGDEVGVSGSVTTANPMVVNANIVRDYSIIMLRPGLRRGQPSSPFYNGVGNGGGNGNGDSQGQGEGDGVSAGASTSAAFSTQLTNLLNQLHDLQNLAKGNGNGNGNGKGKDN